MTTWQEKRLDGWRLVEVVGLDAVNARTLEGWLPQSQMVWRVQELAHYQHPSGASGTTAPGEWVCLMWAPEEGP